MPSPVVHSVAGLVLARFMPPRAQTGRARLAVLGAFIFAANAPDLDFIPGIVAGQPVRFHHGATHSLLASAVFCLAAILGARWAGCRSAVKLGLLLGIAYTSHLVFDMLASSSDGLPLGWPLMTRRFAFPFATFVGLRFEPATGSFVESVLHPHNLLAVVWEFAILAAIWALALVASRARKKDVTA